jgi:hypothetical protein
MTVNSTDLADSGTYMMKLTASPLLGVTKSVDFVLKMINICEQTTFYTQKISSVRAFVQDPEFKSQDQISFEEFKYEAKEVYQVDCGPV